MFIVLGMYLTAKLQTILQSNILETVATTLLRKFRFKKPLFKFYFM